MQADISRLGDVGIPGEYGYKIAAMYIQAMLGTSSSYVCVCRYNFLVVKNLSIASSEACLKLLLKWKRWCKFS